MDTRMALLVIYDMRYLYYMETFAYLYNGNTIVRGRETLLETYTV